MLPQAPRNSPNNRERQQAIKAGLVRSLQLRPRSLHFPVSIPFFFLILFACLAAACSPQDKVNPAEPWDYSDMRTLSEPDQKTDPGDFIAGYARIAGSDLQLRFDFLDMGIYPQNDFYIALDYQPGGSSKLPVESDSKIAWDSLVYLPANGIPQVFSQTTDRESPLDFADLVKSADQDVPIPRFVRVPWQDYILVSINKTFIPGYSNGVRIQAFSSLPGSKQVRDSIGPFNSKDPPPEQAPLLLSFWNTFPAFSPAQALRKWDGAHTGPYGERHGLAILLGNIARYSVPAVLLDLRDPASLSALDHINALTPVKALHSKKLLTLPDSLPGSPTFPLFPAGLPDDAPKYYLERSRQVSERYSIPPSDILYIPGDYQELEPGYALYFTPEEQTSRFASQIPIPHQASQEPQASPEGLSLAIRLNLINNALTRDSNPGDFPVLVLGGSFQDSAFGDPAASSAALSYIANHPWLKPLNIDDLRALSSETEFQYPPGATQVSNTEQFIPSAILATLPDPGGSGVNSLQQEAWASTYSLYSALPPEPETLAQLRAAYSGQPGTLLAAGRWADESYSAQHCRVDLDLDGFPECILASENQFAVIDPLGARLIAYFYRDETGVHQLIAPSNQFIVGIGDPSTWNLDAGDGADPAGIHGAFADSPPPWPLYSISPASDGITLTSPDQQIEKTFSLEEDGLDVLYRTSGDVASRIPFAIDPWTRFSPGWSETLEYSAIENGMELYHQGDMIMEITSDTSMHGFSFSDSSESLSSPENPNFDYPPGHYLLFPMTVVEFHGQGDFNFYLRPAR